MRSPCDPAHHPRREQDELQVEGHSGAEMFNVQRTAKTSYIEWSAPAQAALWNEDRTWPPSKVSWMFMVLLMLLSGSTVLNSISELAVCRGSGNSDTGVAIRSPSAVALVSRSPSPCNINKTHLYCAAVGSAHHTLHAGRSNTPSGAISSHNQNSAEECMSI